MTNESNIAIPSPYQWADILDSDRELFERELKSFIPPDVFDAHAHLWRKVDLGFPTPALAAAGPDEVTRDVYNSRMNLWMPDRAPTAGLFFPFPARSLDVNAANDFLIRELEQDQNSRGLMILTPRQNPADVEQLIQRHKLSGFKVYHLFAEREETMFAHCAEYIPEWGWEIANTYGLAIMLHIVLPKAIADPANQQYIRDQCERYPNVKLILAHAARGFCGRHTVAGVGSLRGIDNVYFDTSAVCEPEAFEAILQVFGPTRLFFGADFCVTEMRSRCINLGDGFLWLDELHPNYQKSRYAQPTLLGIESLLALKQACQNQHLNDGDVEEIFCLAARRVLDLPLPRQLPDTQAAYKNAKEIIPGGTQMLSKRPEMFAPEQWPAYYREARGCEIIDISGKRYIDMSLGGILACLLGYSDPDVNAAVMRRVSLGSMSTLQTYDEVELAQLLIDIHPWARKARFTRSGGESMAVAVRIARAYTGKDQVAICGYHGWHDWYLAANLIRSSVPDGAGALADHLLPGLDPAGVPTGLAGSTMTFHYNRLDELDALLTEHRDELAAIVMEPTRHTDPVPGFLEGVRERCDQVGIPLIFDEISSGWRQCLGGAHLKYGVTPDIAVFAKALGNGFPIGAIIGNSHVMQAAEDSFISSTFWTEGIGPAAALACVRKLSTLDAPQHLNRIGQMVMVGWEELGKQHGIPIQVSGRPSGALLSFQHEEAAALQTLMTARLLRHGFLGGGAFNATLAHEEKHVESYLGALDEIFAELAISIRENSIRSRIGGPVKQTGFARLT